jgi:hypothetical protein
MKKYLFLSLIAMSFASLYAQDCTPWFPFAEGTVFEYSFFDKKDKLSSRIEYVVKEVTKDGSGMAATVESTFFDKKDKEAGAFEFNVSCADGNYRANVSNFMNPALKEMFGTVEMTVTGDDLVIPKDIKVGDKLPDANSHMETAMGVITMKMDMEVTNREVVGKDKVTTPAGSFDAFKVTSDEHIKMSIMNRSSSSIYYYAPGYGQVRYEYFDKKGNMDSYMLLTKFEAP